MSTFAQRLACRLTRVTLAAGIYAAKTTVNVAKGVAEGCKDIPPAVKHQAQSIKLGVQEGKRLARATPDETLEPQA